MDDRKGHNLVMNWTKKVELERWLRNTEWRVRNGHFEDVHEFVKFVQNWLDMDLEVEDNELSPTAGDNQG